jgi:hypothetical protein
MSKVTLGADYVAAIRKGMARSGVDAKALQERGGFVALADDTGRSATLLVPAARVAATDAFVAKVVSEGEQVGKIDVTVAEETYEADGLGEFRALTVELAQLGALANGDVAVHVELGEQANDVSIDLTQAMEHVLKAQEVMVGPQRDAQVERQVIKLTPGQRRMLKGFNAGLDPGEYIGAQQFKRLMAAYRAAVKEMAGVESLAAVQGWIGDRELPSVSQADVERLAPDGEDTDADVAALAAQTSPPDELYEGTTAYWEHVLDNLDQVSPAPDSATVRKVRALYASSKTDLFNLGDDGPEVTLNGGADRLTQATRARTAQLSSAMSELDIPPATTKQLATYLAEALMPATKPSVLVVVGPRHSAADALMDAAVASVGGKALQLQGAELSEPTVPLLGKKNAIPVSEGKLNPVAMEGARAGGDFAGVVLDRLADIGGGGPGRLDEEKLSGLLAELQPMVASGVAKGYARKPGGPANAAPQLTDTALKNTVFVLRWDDDAESFESFLGRQSPEVRAMLSKHVAGPPVSPGATPRLVERELQLTLKQRGAPSTQTVSLSAGLQETLSSLADQNRTSEAFDVFLPRLRAVVEGAMEGTTAPLEIDWSDELSPREMGKLAASGGEAVPGLEDVPWFTVRAAFGDQRLVVTLADDWQAVEVEAKKAAGYRAEIARLQALLAAQGPQ